MEQIQIQYHFFRVDLQYNKNSTSENGKMCVGCFRSSTSKIFLPPKNFYLVTSSASNKREKKRTPVCLPKQRKKKRKIFLTRNPKLQPTMPMPL
jgi:hypothetical protein